MIKNYDLGYITRAARCVNRFLQLSDSRFLVVSKFCSTFAIVNQVLN